MSSSETHTRAILTQKLSRASSWRNRAWIGPLQVYPQQKPRGNLESRAAAPQKVELQPAQDFRRSRGKQVDLSDAPPRSLLPRHQVHSRPQSCSNHTPAPIPRHLDASSALGAQVLNFAHVKLSRHGGRLRMVSGMLSQHWLLINRCTVRVESTVGRASQLIGSDAEMLLPASVQ